MNKEAIMLAHPSICYGCENDRRPWSENLRAEGYVGCAEYLRRDQSNVDFVGPAKELVTGWVDLRSDIFSLKCSGVLTNEQLMTLGVQSCEAYKKKS